MTTIVITGVTRGLGKIIADNLLKDPKIIDFTKNGKAGSDLLVLRNDITDIKSYKSDYSDAKSSYDFISNLTQKTSKKTNKRKKRKSRKSKHRQKRNLKNIYRRKRTRKRGGMNNDAWYRKLRCTTSICPNNRGGPHIFGNVKESDGTIRCRMCRCQSVDVDHLSNQWRNTYLSDEDELTHRLDRMNLNK